MGRVGLLCVFIWAHERIMQEYVAIRQTLAEPDPLRLMYRTLIKDTVRAVVLQPQADAQTVLDAALSAALPADMPEAEHQALRALILDELRRLHEGVLARYGLRPSQLQAWKDVQGFSFNSCWRLLHKR